MGVLPRPCADWQIEERAHGVQLTCTRAVRPAGQSVPWRALGDEDVPSMFDLTARVFPGYFRERTLEMGSYLGIFADERLVALAGERMNLGDRCEISAVCADPSRTGRGHARQLVHALVDAALQRGSTPFLHELLDLAVVVRRTLVALTEGQVSIRPRLGVELEEQPRVRHAPEHQIARAALQRFGARVAHQPTQPDVAVAREGGERLVHVEATTALVRDWPD